MALKLGGGAGGGGGGRGGRSAAPRPPVSSGVGLPSVSPACAPGEYSCRGGCRAAAGVGRGPVGRQWVSVAGGGGGGEGGGTCPPWFAPPPSAGWSTLADDLKRARVSRLLPKVTCPSPFHPRARTVQIAELQDVPVTETEKRGLSTLAPLAGVSPPPSGLSPGGGKSGRPIAQANIQLEWPEFDPKNLPEWAEEVVEFLLLTGQSHVDVATKCSLLKRSCKEKFLQKQVKQIVKTCSTWAEVLQRLEKTFPVYETDLGVRKQIEELPMLPEFPSAARVSEYVCDLEYLFSRMNLGSYEATEPHLWLMSKIPTRTWDDCRATSERESRTHSYDDLVDLLIELALERENDSHVEKFVKKDLGRGGTPIPERGEGKGPKNPTNANQGGGEGRGNLRAMKEVTPDAGTPPLFYCKPVNDKGGPCHAPDCDHHSSCML